MKRFAAALAAALISALLLPGALHAYRLFEHWERSFEMAARPRLVLENVNGSIEVTGWDRRVIDVQAEIRVKAASKDKARRIYEQIEFDVEHEAGALSIRADLPRIRKDGLWGESATSVSVNYIVRVPHGCDVDLQSVNGRINASEIEGAFRLRTVNGGIRLLSRAGAGEMESVNGALDCRLGKLSGGGKLRLKTTNGSIDLRLPGPTSADFEARTLNGSVKVDLELANVKQSRRNRVSGRLGGGDGSIKLRTVNGRIALGSI